MKKEGSPRSTSPCQACLDLKAVIGGRNFVHSSEIVEFRKPKVRVS
jgi:hypothetical protein